MVKVHYFFDPLCGWCFGATALIDAINNMDNVELILLKGQPITRLALPLSLFSLILFSLALLKFFL